MRDQDFSQQGKVVVGRGSEMEAIAGPEVLKDAASLNVSLLASVSSFVKWSQLIPTT